MKRWHKKKECRLNNAVCVLACWGEGGTRHGLPPPPLGAATGSLDPRLPKHTGRKDAPSLFLLLRLSLQLYACFCLAQHHERFAECNEFLIVGAPLTSRLSKAFDPIIQSNLSLKSSDRVTESNHRLQTIQTFITSLHVHRQFSQIA